MNKRFIVITISLITLIVLVGCPRNEEKPGVNQSPNNNQSSSSGAIRNPEQIYRWPLPTDPPTLDPAHITDSVSAAVANQIFDGLVRFDASGKLIPDIAETWESDIKGQVWTFHLRPDLRFHNGDLLTAKDVVYSLQRILDPKTRSERANLLKPIKGAQEFYTGKATSVSGIKEVSPTVVEITLKQPNAPFVYILPMCNFSIISKKDIDSHPNDFGQNPAGSGPFVFEKWTRNDSIQLKPFAQHYNGEPKLRGILFRIIPDEMTRFQEFVAGNIEHTNIPAGKMQEVNGDKTLKALVKFKPAMDMYAYAFNCEKPPFKDNIKLRLAINAAINRDAIVENVLEGRGEVMKGYVPPGSWYTNPIATGFEYNVDHAKKLMTEAGYPNGKGLAPIQLYIDNDSTRKQVSEFVQSDLKKIGVEVEIHSSDWATLLDDIYAGKHMFFQNTWLADYPDPDNWLWTLLSTEQIGAPGNIARFSNKEFDQLTRDAQKVADQNLRLKLYQKAEDIALAEMPWVPLFVNSPVTLVQPWVNNFELSVLDRSPQLGGCEFEKVSISN